MVTPIRKYLLPALLALSLALSGCQIGNLRAVRSQNPFLKKLPDSLIDFGPVLGYAGPTELNLGVKTDEKACVTLEIDHRRFISSRAKYHQFHVTGLLPGTSYQYRFKVQETEEEKQHLLTKWYRTKTFPGAKNRLHFCVYGDLRTQPGIWKQIAAAMAKVQPDFAVALGDLVLVGADKREWRTNFFEPAAAFFAAVPQYIVKGNHDIGGERWLRLFQSPGGGGNWSQVIGQVQLIGIDINTDWSEESYQAHWLETVISASSSPYVFVALHAPPYTSKTYGRRGEDNPRNSLIRRSRTKILPILKRHPVTALLAAHVHAYERSELPGGPTIITSGGAGAPLSRAGRQVRESNPYSKVYFPRYHYLNFTVTAKNCKMSVIDLNGNTIDTRVWEPIAR